MSQLGQNPDIKSSMSPNFSSTQPQGKIIIGQQQPDTFQAIQINQQQNEFSQRVADLQTKLPQDNTQIQQELKANIDINFDQNANQQASQLMQAQNFYGEQSLNSNAQSNPPQTLVISPDIVPNAQPCKEQAKHQTFQQQSQLSMEEQQYKNQQPNSFQISTEENFNNIDNVRQFLMEHGLLDKFNEKMGHPERAVNTTSVHQDLQMYQPKSQQMMALQDHASDQFFQGQHQELLPQQEMMIYKDGTDSQQVYQQQNVSEFQQVDQNFALAANQTHSQQISNNYLQQFANSGQELAFNQQTQQLQTQIEADIQLSKKELESDQFVAQNTPQNINQSKISQNLNHQSNQQPDQHDLINAVQSQQDLLQNNERFPPFQSFMQQPQVPTSGLNPSSRSQNNQDISNPKTINSIAAPSGQSSNSVFKEELQAYQGLVKNMHAQLKNLTGVMSQLQKVSTNLKNYKGLTNSASDKSNSIPENKKESSSGSMNQLNAYSPLQILQNQMQGISQMPNQIMPKGSEQASHVSPNMTHMQSLMHSQGPQQRTSQMPLMNYQSTNSVHRFSSLPKATKHSQIQQQMSQKLPQSNQVKLQQFSSLEMPKKSQIPVPSTNRLQRFSPSDQQSAPDNQSVERQSPMTLPQIGSFAGASKDIQTNDDLQKYLMGSGLFQSYDSSLKEWQSKSSELQQQKRNQNMKLVEAGIVQASSTSKQPDEIVSAGQQMQMQAQMQPGAGGVTQQQQVVFENQSSGLNAQMAQNNKYDDNQNQQNLVVKNTPNNTPNNGIKPALPVVSSDATIQNNNDAHMQLQMQLKMVQEQAQQFISNTQNKFTNMLSLIAQTKGQASMPSSTNRSPAIFKSQGNLPNQQNETPNSDGNLANKNTVNFAVLNSQQLQSQALQRAFDSSPMTLNPPRTSQNAILGGQQRRVSIEANQFAPDVTNQQQTTQIGQNNDQVQNIHQVSNNGVAIPKTQTTNFLAEQQVSSTETKKGQYDIQQQQRLNDPNKMPKEGAAARLVRFQSCPQSQSKDKSVSLCSVAQLCPAIQAKKEINQNSNEEDQQKSSVISYRNNMAKKELSDQEESSNSDYYLNQRDLYVGKYPQFNAQNQGKKPNDSSVQQEGKNKMLAFELKLVDKLQQMDQGLEIRDLNALDQKTDSKRCLQGDGDSDEVSPNPISQGLINQRKSSVDLVNDNREKLQALSQQQKSQMALFPRFKSTNIRVNQPQAFHSNAQIQFNKNYNLEKAQKFYERPLLTKYTSVPIKMPIENNEQLMRIMNQRQAQLDAQNLFNNQNQDSSAKKQGQQAAQNSMLISTKFYSESMTKEEKANSEGKQCDLFESQLNDKALLEAQAIQNEGKLPFVLYLNMARTNFSSKNNQKEQQVKQYQQDAQVGKRFFSNSIRFNSQNQKNGEQDDEVSALMVDEQASSSQYQESQNTAKAASLKSGSAKDLVDIQTRMNQINMAIQTVNDNQFIILKSVQKESRRSGKLPVAALNDLESKTDKEGQTAADSGGKNSQAFNQSNYRGVCSNGTKWQTMVLDRGFKYYSTSLVNQDLAARVYDRFVLESQGLRAKTNFNYNRMELMLILKDIAADFKFNNSADVQQNRKRISFNSFRMPPDLLKYDQMSVPFYEKRRMAKGSRKKREQQQTEQNQ